MVLQKVGAVTPSGAEKKKAENYQLARTLADSKERKAVSQRVAERRHGRCHSLRELELEGEHRNPDAGNSHPNDSKNVVEKSTRKKYAERYGHLVSTEKKEELMKQRLDEAGLGNPNNHTESDH